MSCTGCSNHTTASNASDAAFRRFWPAGLPGPQLLPWLGVASRDEARAGALAIGADRDPGVLAGDEPAMPHLIGRTMGGGGVYAQERKGRKKGGGGGYDCMTGPLDLGECPDWVRDRCFVWVDGVRQVVGTCLPLGNHLVCGACESGFTRPGLDIPELEVESV